MPVSHGIAVAAFLFALGSAGSAAACGGSQACRVDGGEYRIELPEGKSPKGVYIFFHGYKSSAELQMQHRALVETAHRHGLAFVAVNGEGGTWSHPNAPAQLRDEKRFVSAVLDDLAQRFGFSPDRTIVGGFSQGASMAWYTLCSEGKRLAGAVTFSGVFWDPLPEPADCTPDIPKIVHFHGTADRTFPLAGRAIGDRWHQGDTFRSFGIVREAASCGPRHTTRQIAGIACDATPDCKDGELALCIHGRGHQVDPDQLDAGLVEIGF